jgi:hypothetical protein
MPTSADVALLVGVDHVVHAGFAGGAGTAEGNARSSHILNFKRDVLHDMPHPGAFVLGQAAQETTLDPVGATVFLQARQRLLQAVGKTLAAHFTEGQSTSIPISSTMRMTGKLA